MNFHEKREIPPKYIYLCMSIICFILLFLSVIFEKRFSPLKAVTSTIITPMQSGVNKLGYTIFGEVTAYKEKAALIEENNDLQNKIKDYSAQIKIYEQERYELERLQELLNLKEQYVQYNTIGARVIATDSTNWFYTFVIDKGENDGVQVGCNILAGNGLAGIVTEVGSNYSKVRAIIDDNSNVSATISGTETLCTVTGDLSTINEGYINVGYINKSDTIEDGAELVTSHVSDKFLPGLLIGYITEVEVDANNLTKSAKCIPVVDFKNLQEVLIVLDMKSDYDTNSINKNIFDSISSTEEANQPSESDITGYDNDEQDSSSDSIDSNEYTSGTNDTDDDNQPESDNNTDAEEQDEPDDNTDTESQDDTGNIDDESQSEQDNADMQPDAGNSDETSASEPDNVESSQHENNNSEQESDNNE